MDVTAISDLHGFKPKLDGGDLLLIAGDLCRRNDSSEYREFYRWCEKQPYTWVIVIAGNHDRFRVPPTEWFLPSEKVHYLEDSGVQVGDHYVYGFPWIPAFTRLNPRYASFAVPEERLAKETRHIPDQTTILLSHGPALGYGDLIELWGEKFHVGSAALRERMEELSDLKAHIFGHIHEGYGRHDTIGAHPLIRVNASLVNDRYLNTNEPIYLTL